MFEWVHKLFLVVNILVTSTGMALGNELTGASSFPAVSSASGGLVGRDGQPFYWLADTAWDLLYRLEPSEIDYYLAVRKSQGFNVVIFQLLSGNLRERAPNGSPILLHERGGNLDVISLDPRFLEYSKLVVQKANRAGFTVVLLLSWGSNVSNGRFSVQQAFLFGKRIAETFGDLDVIWLLGGDTNPSVADVEVWISMAQGVRAGEPTRHLMTFHPNRGSSSLWFGSDSMDFTSIQSGHARIKPRTQPSFAQAIRREVDLHPKTPVIDLESGYEDIPNGLAGLHPEDSFVSPQDRFNDYDIRVRAYQTLLSGSFGYTYGALDVAKFWELGARNRWPPNHPWRDALFLPGAVTLKHYIEVRKYLATEVLKPKDDLLIQNQNRSVYNTIMSACGAGYKKCIVYSPSGDTIKIFKENLPSNIEIFVWVDPRTGKFEKAIPIPDSVGDSGTVEFQPPYRAPALREQLLGNGNDWLLLMGEADQQ